MDKSLTEIAFILDASGSMSGLEKDTIGGFNEFVKSQSELGKTLVTAVAFNHDYKVVFSREDSKKVKLTKKEYKVGGQTALLDAIGRTINELGNKLNETPEEERPGKVIVVITTDGEENSSKEFTYDEIKEMIKHQEEKYSWEFIFMGANIDVEEEGMKLGLRAERSVSYKATPDGLSCMYESVSTMSKQIRQN